MQRASANYIFGRFHLDAAERRLTRDGEVIPLTPKAFEVLVTLLQRAGHVVTKDELMRAVWPDGFVEDVNLAYNISVLRKALADGRAEGSYIETVPKLGYRFVAPIDDGRIAPPSSPSPNAAALNFGDLLNQHLHRRHGLSQGKLAAGVMQAPSVISHMCRGRRLNGPQARERVLAIIGWLREQGALETADEADALLHSAGMAGLREGVLRERATLDRLKSEVAIPRAVAAAPRRTNLPAQLTRFVGRERELADAMCLVREKRLVTLTGSAGMGKTRLVLEVGAAVAEAFPDGVWLVELAPLADGELVPGAVADALDVAEQQGRSMTKVLAGVIGEGHMLVILDNCEHLIDAIARLAESLLRACPRLHILATSREALRLPGEVVRQVPQLGAPDPADPASIDRALAFDAVRLFAELAAAAQPGFSVTTANQAVVARICHQLDGMPLALEMAAAQVVFLGLSGVAAGLADRFSMLEAGSRAAAPHQRTLRATLDWSHALLSEPERALLARLSVFAGGWTAEAARVVCQSTHHDLVQLVRKSLVMIVPAEGGEPPRYRMLETIREYAAEKLRERGEREATLERHLQCFLALLDEPIELAGPRMDPWLLRMDADLDNVRAAFTWAMQRPDSGEAAMRLTAGISRYVYHRGHLTEFAAWAEQAWARGRNASDQARAYGILARGSASILRGAKAEGLRYCREALPLFREAGDKVYLADCLEVLANNSYDDSVGLYAEEALRLYRQLGSRDGEARALRALGFAALHSGDRRRAADLLEHSIAAGPWDADTALGLLYEAAPGRALQLAARVRAGLASSTDLVFVASTLPVYGVLLIAEGQIALSVQVLEEAVRVGQMLKSQRFDATLLRQPVPLDLAGFDVDRHGSHGFCLSLDFLNLGYAEHLLGNADRARVRLQQARQFSRSAGMRWFEAMADFLLATLESEDSGRDATFADLRDCLRCFSDLDQPVDTMCALVQIANGLGRRDSVRDARLATYLLGAVSPMSERASGVASYYDLPLRHWLQRSGVTIIRPTLAAARAALGEAAFEAAYAEGQRMMLDEAVVLALAEE